MNFILTEMPCAIKQPFQRGTKYFMGFTEIFGLGGPNILKCLVRGGQNLGGDKMFRDRTCY